MPKRKKSFRSSRIMLIFLLFLAAVCSVGFAETKKVVIRDGGQRKVVRTVSENPAEIIKAAGIEMKEADRYEILGGNLDDGFIIQILRAKTFIVHDEKESREFTSTGKTIGEALKSVGISPKKKKIYPEVDAALENDAHIYVIKKDEEFVFSEVPIEVPVEYREDHDLAFGTEKVIHEGKPGALSVVSKSIKEEDGNYNVIELSRKEKIKPEGRIIIKGMGMSVSTPNGYKRYTKKIRCEATAYIATGNPTAIGIMPYWGVIAVDPRVIPLGTKVYIPNYGIALAADTGGAVRGNIIDLFMNTYSQAINWGRRNVDVYILVE